MEKFRRWLHGALYLTTVVVAACAHYAYINGDILNAIYFMISTIVILMMLSMTEDYDE